MRFIDKINVEIPGVNQEFELGDLTIFIGRSNSGKTRILNEIYNKIQEIKGFFDRNKPLQTIESNAKRTGIELGNKIEKPNPLFITSPRGVEGSINTYSGALNKINESSKKIDPTIIDFGNQGVEQSDGHKQLSIQGSGIQNMAQILSKSYHENNFVLIDEPEISQFPTGKIEIIKRFIELLDNKQVVFATHDPTLINQYLIKKLMGNKDFKIIMYSFCEGGFKKIDFSSNLDPEIHCGYLSQTFSGKPVHLVFEGQTEFYAFQALLHKYCLNKKIKDFPRVINKINLSHLGGEQWKINMHHLPPPEHYDVLMILDGEYQKDVQRTLPIVFKKIDSVEQIEGDKVNLLCLKANNIEEAFNEIIPLNVSIGKPLGLSKYFWETDHSIINKIEKNPDSKDIHDIIEWAIKKAQMK